MGEHFGKRLGTILIGLGMLDTEQQDAALEYASRWGVPFGKACLRMGLVSEEAVVHGLAIQSGSPSVRLSDAAVPFEVLDLLPAGFAEEFRVIPLQRIAAGPGRQTLVVAMARPKDLRALDSLAFTTGCRIEPVIASDGDIDRALLRFYGIDVDRHLEEATIEGSLEDPGEAEVVHDALRLALDFLPTVTVR